MGYTRGWERWLRVGINDLRIALDEGLTIPFTGEVRIKGDSICTCNVLLLLVQVGHASSVVICVERIVKLIEQLVIRSSRAVLPVPFVCRSSLSRRGDSCGAFYIGSGVRS